MQQPDEEPSSRAFRRKGSLPGPHTSTSSLDVDETSDWNKNQRASLGSTPEAHCDGHDDPCVSAPASPSHHKGAKDWLLQGIFRRKGSRKASLNVEGIEARDDFIEGSLSLSDRDPLENISPVDQGMGEVLVAPLYCI